MDKRAKVESPDPKLDAYNKKIGSKIRDIATKSSKEDIPITAETLNALSHDIASGLLDLEAVDSSTTDTRETLENGEIRRVSEMSVAVYRAFEDEIAYRGVEDYTERLDVHRITIGDQTIEAGLSEDSKVGLLTSYWQSFEGRLLDELRKESVDG